MAMSLIPDGPMPVSLPTQLKPKFVDLTIRYEMMARRVVSEPETYATASWKEGPDRDAGVVQTFPPSEEIMSDPPEYNGLTMSRPPAPAIFEYGTLPPPRTNSH
jgi:hypothetical protein